MQVLREREAHRASLVGWYDRQNACSRAAVHITLGDLKYTDISYQFEQQFISRQRHDWNEGQSKNGGGRWARLKR